MSAIEQCRSAALGGHVLRCGACDHQEISYNSCRNRQTNRPTMIGLATAGLFSLHATVCDKYCFEFGAIVAISVTKPGLAKWRTEKAASSRVDPSEEFKTENVGIAR